MADGLVNDVHFSAFIPGGTLGGIGFNLNWMGATAFANSIIPGGGPFVTQSYVGLLTNILEPETYTLMLGGLAALRIIARRRSRVTPQIRQTKRTKSPLVEGRLGEF